MRKNLALLCIMIFFVSCESQLGTAVSTVFSNIVSGNGFSNSTSDELYNQMKEKTLSGPDTSIENTVCPDPLAGAIVFPKKIATNMSKIKDNLCTCKAWGTCTKDACQCEVLCPKDFKILERPHETPLDAPENSLAFTNNDKSFKEKNIFYTGYCWGHAVVTQRFNRLATFVPTERKLFSSPDESSQRIRQYKYIIGKLNNNEPTDIPGFKNLQEFSSDPEVKDLLQDSVKENWAKNAMSSQGLSMVAGSEPEGEEYYNKLFDDVEFRLKNNQSPVIVFNEHDNSSRSHSVLVSGSGVEPTGERYLCIRDNNIAAERSVDCKNKMVLNKDGTIKYSLWKVTLGKVKLSYTENSNTLEQVNNLHTKCTGDKNCTVQSRN